MELNNIIKEYLMLNRYNLSNEEINWITAYINSSPESLKSVTDGINEIIKDNVINIHDIPIIINIITTIYHNESIKNEIVNSNNIIIFVKFTLNSIIDSKFILLPEIEKEIIEKLINSSLDLIRLNITTINNDTEYCCNILKSMKIF